MATRIETFEEKNRISFEDTLRWYMGNGWKPQHIWGVYDSRKDVTYFYALVTKEE